MLTLFLTVTLLRVSIRQHYRQRISLCTKVTKTIKIKSTVIYGNHNKVKGLKLHIVLYSKADTVLKVYINYNQYSINANRMQWLYVQTSVSGSRYTQFQNLRLCIIFKFRLLFVSHIVIFTCAAREPLHKSVCGWPLAKKSLGNPDLRGESVTSTQHKVKRRLFLCLIKYHIDVA